MDWDKLRIFHAAAEAGSFTHAGDALKLSQSAVSRQVSALEKDLQTPLFHRHARGLMLTEQGELLFRTVQEVIGKLEATRSRLTDSRERPHGELRITTNLGFGQGWLIPRLREFLDLYPDVRVRMLLTDDDLDLGMREADVALRLREPEQPDLIRRRLFTIYYHLYASPEYVKEHGQPQTLDDLSKHRLLSLGVVGANYLDHLNAHLYLGRGVKNARVPSFSVNNIPALHSAVSCGLGIATLPDYLVGPESNLMQLMPQTVTPELEVFFVYAEEMKNVARVQVFRDFLVDAAKKWRQ
ncbi:LysR family transcriptional regulator [Beijerinckia sp. L45]|uniref:LysR family transcriptional regulator n=1 Tax=Beijerinckia sp. L45 TaxID=1641855 RepID=UPI00131E8835|nr:LysR family transcriptional regulator [Beijerinckia sp. L45]